MRLTQDEEELPVFYDFQAARFPAHQNHEPDRIEFFDDLTQDEKNEEV